MPDGMVVTVRYSLFVILLLINPNKNTHINFYHLRISLQVPSSNTEIFTSSLPYLLKITHEFSHFFPAKFSTCLIPAMNERVIMTGGAGQSFFFYSDIKPVTIIFILDMNLVLIEVDHDLFLT